MARAGLWGAVAGLALWLAFRIFGIDASAAPHLVDSPTVLVAGGAFWFAVVYALRQGKGWRK